MAEAAQKQLLTSIKTALRSGVYSDLTISCGSDTYKVHKVIICERADFFARALKFGGQESELSKIDLPDDDPATVKLLVQYLYEGEYAPFLPAEGSLGEHCNTERPRTIAAGTAYNYIFPHTCSEQGYICNTANVCPHHTCTGSYSRNIGCRCRCQAFTCQICKVAPLPELNGTTDQLLIHAKMYELADKYDVVGLKDLVKEKFSRACQHFWDDSEFPRAAHHAFSTTPDDDKGLRDIISATISQHMELVDKPEIKVLMTEFNGLALGILEEKIIEHGWGKK